jgi:hypothetical protein
MNFICILAFLLSITELLLTYLRVFDEETLVRGASTFEGILVIALP